MNPQTGKRRRNHIAIMVVVSLITGTAGALLMPVSGDAPEPMSIEVAPARIGDIAEYAAAWRDEWTYADGTSQGWQDAYTTGQRISEPMIMTADDGREVWSIGVEYANFIDGGSGTLWNSARYDLADGSHVSASQHAGDPLGDFATRAAYRSPAHGTPPVTFDPMWGGFTLTLGDDLTHHIEAHEHATCGLLGHWYCERLDHVSWTVDAAGTIDGEPALALTKRLEGTFDWRHQEPGIHGVDIERHWFVADIPVPVRSESTWEATRADGSVYERWDETLVLAAFAPGSGPIPWGEPGPELAPAPALPRAVPQRDHPEARGARVAYDLAAALDAVTEDPILLELRTWQATNPDHWVAGIEYHADLLAGGPAWIITYASSPSEAFAVMSQLQPAPLGARNLDRATPALPGLGPHLLPEGALQRADDQQTMVTLAAADALAGTVVEPGLHANGITWLHWGLDVASEAPDTVWRASVPVSWPITIEYAPQAATAAANGEYAQGAVIEADTGLIASAWLRPVEVGYERISGSATRAQQVQESDPGAGNQAQRRVDPAVAAPLVSGSILGALLIAYFWPALRFAAAQGLVFVIGYAKVRGAKTLNHPMRERLVELIRSNPGITAPEMHKQVEGGWTTVVYHLRVLEREKFVSSTVDGRYRRFFERDSVEPSRRGRLGVLRNERTRSILDRIRRDPGVAHGRLAKDAGVSMPAVYWHIDRLETVGLVGRDKVGRTVRYYPLEDTSMGRQDVT